MDFDDVSQIIRIHVYRKWHLYDQARPLAPWLNQVISAQMKNLIRNNHGNYCRPCLRCDAAESDDLCRIYGKQCSGCPLYAHWEKTKKSAYDIKIPVPLENHAQEVYDMSDRRIDVDKSARELTSKMEKVLKPVELRVYRMLYVEHLTEEQVAEKLGYRTTEKNRSPGYKHIKNLKKSIISKARQLISGEEVDVIWT